MNLLSNKYTKEQQLKIASFGYSLEDFGNGYLVTQLKKELSFDQFAEALSYILQKILSLSLSASSPEIQDQIKAHLQTEDYQKALETLSQDFLDQPLQYYLLIEKGIQLGVAVMKVYFESNNKHLLKNNF